MARKRFTAEQVIMKLREAEVDLAPGQTVGQVSKQIEVTEQTRYRWRKEYGGLRLVELFVDRGMPEFIRSDNGSEFTAQAVRDWLKAVGVKNPVHRARQFPGRMGTLRVSKHSA